MKLEKIFDVRGNISMVTGAASGLGLSISEAMADNGAHVIMTDINPETLEKESARLRAAGGSAETIVLDVGDLDKLRATIDGVVAKHGRIDSLFANAGITSGPGFRFAGFEVEVYPKDKWDNAIHINLTSIFVAMSTAAAHMKKQKSGRI